MNVLTTTDPTQGQPNTGARLVATGGRSLPLQSCRLRTTAGGGLARTVLEQTFHNPHTEPLTVTYQLPLPADGAVSAFAFRIGERRIVGEIDGRSAARERFETAVADGHSAALLEEDRSSLFTQEIGNIPPGEDLIAELAVDQPLLWLTEGSWEWRFPTTAGPRYSGAAGRVEDADRISVDVADQAPDGRLAFELTVDDDIAHGAPVSPSHQIVTSAGRDQTRVALAEGDRAGLDRDLVVRWRAAAEDLTTRLEVAPNPEGEGFGLLTLLPPQVALPSVARDVMVLFDTSGSMHGEPLDQAKHVVAAIIRSLQPCDQLEMIEFSTQQRSFKRKPLAMTPRGQASALAWVDSLRAGGATEMCEAISAALTKTSSESQRQIVLVTDGLIGFESEIVAEILQNLPNASRVHTIGVGSGVNRALTEAAARAGRGAEAILGIDEAPEPVARRITARMASPSVVDLALRGDAVLEAAPTRLPDLFAGAPVRIAVRVRPEGGTLQIEGRTATGTWTHGITVPPSGAADGRPEVAALFARETVADLELRRTAGEDGARLDATIAATGLKFGIATRLTSWIAVSDEQTVDPTQASRRERVPHELPFGMSIAGLGLREACASSPSNLVAKVKPCAAPPPGRSAKRRKSGFGSLLDRSQAPEPAGEAQEPLAQESWGPAPPDVEGKIQRDDALADDIFAEEILEPAPKTDPLPEWRGRITKRGDGQWIVEIDVSREAWHLPESVLVGFADREEHSAEVDRDHSTAEGLIPSGALVRLVLNWTQPPTEAEALDIRLETSDGLRRIRLR